MLRKTNNDKSNNGMNATVYNTVYDAMRNTNISEEDARKVAMVLSRDSSVIEHSLNRLGRSIHEIKTEMRSNKAEAKTDLDTKVNELKTEMRSNKAEAKTDLDTKVNELKTEMKSDKDELKQSIVENSRANLIAIMIGMGVAVGIIGVMITILGIMLQISLP